MLLYAVMEFYPLYYGLTTAILVAVCGAGLCFAFIFPKAPIIDKVNAPVVVYLLALSAYSLFSYYWALDKNEALYYSTLMLRNALIFIAFSALFRNRRICLKAHWFYLAVLIVYLLTAVWEMLTWQHLPVSRYFGRDTFIPSGPFYGENLLAAFMLMLLPYALFWPKLLHKWWVKILAGFIVLGSILIITVQGARVALLAGFMMLGWVMLKYTSWKSKLLSLVAIVVLSLGVMHVAGPYVRIAWGIFEREMSSIGSETTSVRMSSVKIRQQLVHESLELTAQSGFMGVGAGNFERHMNTDRIYRTAGIVNPHNYFLELMGNFGLGFLVWFLLLYFSWMRGLFLASKEADPPQKSYYLMHFFALLMFIPAGAMPSSIKWNHLIWIMFALFNRISHPDFWRKLPDNEQL